MVGWPHPINGHELEQTPGDGEGQRSLACCTPRGREELDMTEQLNSNRKDNPVFCLSLGSKQLKRRNLKGSKRLVTQLCPTLCDPVDCSPPWDSPGKNTGVGSHFLLQGIFPTQDLLYCRQESALDLPKLGLNLGLLWCRQILYHLSHQES